MNTSRRPLAPSLIIAALILFSLLLLALHGTTWAAPAAQGTVPTPKPTKPTPTGMPTGVPTDAPTDEPTPIQIGGGGGEPSPTAPATPTAPPTPAAPSTTTDCGVGENGAQCSVENLMLTLPAGAAPAGTTITIEGNSSQPPCPPSEPGVVFLQRCYRLTWVSADTQPLTQLNAPVTACLNYAARQVALASNRAENLLVGLASSDGKWSLVKPTVDQINSRVCVTTDRVFAWQALFTTQPTLLPVTGADSSRLILEKINHLLK